jgi:hypothetical protein
MNNMAFADISALGVLKPIDPLDLDDSVYQDSQDFPPPPPKGKYTARAPENFSFGRTQAGALSANLDPIIVGPTNEGFICRFTKASGKVFQRKGANVSQIGDYLRAFGIKTKLTSEADQIEAVESTANMVCSIEGDWRAYNKNTKFQLEGMEKFPSDNNGGHFPWYDDPNDTEKDEAGNVVTDAQGKPVPKRLRANFYVRRFVAA